MSRRLRRRRILEAGTRIFRISGSQRSVDVEALESDWRALYPIAWTDFHRFIKGWSPGHWKINGYSERLARATITKLREVSS